MKNESNKKFLAEPLIIGFVASYSIVSAIIMLTQPKRNESLRNELEMSNHYKKEARQIANEAIDIVVNYDKITRAIEWDRFVNALIEVESGGNTNAVGDGGKAVGVLQIQPIYIAELERLGVTGFTLDDRYDRARSIAMFEAMQDLKNPDRNIDAAVQIHNPGGGDRYRGKIFRAMFGEN